MDQKDMFAPPQLSLFGNGEDDRLDEQGRRSRPRDQRVRERLTNLIDRLRAAERMPLAPQQVRMWQTVFPTMSSALPDAERDELRRAFDHEIERLSTFT